MNRYQIIAPPEIEEEGEKLFKEWMKIGDPDDDFDPEEWEKFLQAHATKAFLEYREETATLKEEAERNNERI